MVTSSYTAAILPNLLTGRKNINYGVFRMKGALGFVMSAIACGYMIVFFVIFCFPFSRPVDAKNMNYACLIWGGLTIFVGIWWVIGASRNGYEGPQTTGGIISEIEAVRRVSINEKRRSV